MRVFLADLGHNLLTYSSDTYPLGVANLATYLSAYLDIDEEIDVSIFREPQDLKAALDEGAPDVLGLSNYAWNEELSYAFCRYAKRTAPNSRTVTESPEMTATSRWAAWTRRLDWVTSSVQLPSSSFTLASARRRSEVRPTSAHIW